LRSWRSQEIQADGATEGLCRWAECDQLHHFIAAGVLGCKAPVETELLIQADKDRPAGRRCRAGGLDPTLRYQERHAFPGGCAAGQYCSAAWARNRQLPDLGFAGACARRKIPVMLGVAVVSPEELDEEIKARLDKAKGKRVFQPNIRTARDEKAGAGSAEIDSCPIRRTGVCASGACVGWEDG